MILNCRELNLSFCKKIYSYNFWHGAYAVEEEQTPSDKKDNLHSLNFQKRKKIFIKVAHFTFIHNTKKKQLFLLTLQKKWLNN